MTESDLLEKREYTIDELAQRASTSVRNVRSYQEKGILPPPEKRGRAGVYNDDHLTRLGIISDLLNRGYTISNIAEMLAALDEGKDLTQLLGVNSNFIRGMIEQKLHVYGSLEELAHRFEPPATPEQIERGVNLGLITVAQHKVYTLHPRILDIGIILTQKGLPLDTLYDLFHFTRGQVDSFINHALQVLIGVIFKGQPLNSLDGVQELSRTALDLQPLLTEALIEEISMAIGQAMTRKMTESLVNVLLVTKQVP